jgi:hypothetical protein
MNARNPSKKEGRHSGLSWTGKYGYNPGETHICVKYITCPWCNARPGNLCIGPTGKKLSTHYMRRNQYTKMKRAVHYERNW